MSALTPDYARRAYQHFTANHLDVRQLDPRWMCVKLVERGIAHNMPEAEDTVMDMLQRLARGQNLGRVS